MVIRSQDRKTLLLIEKGTYFSINESLDKGFISGYTLDYSMPDETIELGVFDSLGEALEELDKLQEMLGQPFTLGRYVIEIGKEADKKVVFG